MAPRRRALQSWLIPSRPSRFGGKNHGGELLLTCAVLASFAAAAMASPRLPLHGFYRPGRYMPVQCDGPTTLSADGAVTTQTDGGVTPWLALETIRSPQWTTPAQRGADFDSPLHPLADDERLIGSTLPSIADAAIAGSRWFPSQRVIPLLLDPADPIPGAPAAWTSLDALILDADSAAIALRGSVISTLLAGGVRLAVQADRPPDVRWPWRRDGQFWVLANDAAPPIDPISPDALAPTETWNPAVDATTRTTAMLAAMLACIGIIAATTWLWRPAVRRRLATAALAAAIAGGWSVAFASWTSRTSATALAGGVVEVLANGYAVHDQWMYARFLKSGGGALPCNGLMFPILSAADAAAQLQLMLRCSGGAHAEWRFQASAGVTLAFVARRILPGVTTPSAGADATPMRILADYYPRTRWIGTTTPDPSDPANQWPGILLGAHSDDSIPP